MKDFLTTRAVVLVAATVEEEAAKGRNGKVVIKVERFIYSEHVLEGSEEGSSGRLQRNEGKPYRHPPQTMHVRFL